MRSTHLLLIFSQFSLFLLLAACAAPPATGGAPGSGIAPPDPAVQATLAARQAQDAAATYDAALAATQTVIQATEQARSQATGTAVTAATHTAVAATSTAADLSVRGTQIALVAIETGHALAAAVTGTHQAAAVSAEMTAQAIHMDNAQMLQEAERQRLAAQQQRQETMNAAIPYLLAAFGLAAVIVTGLFAYLMIRSRNPIYHVEHLGAKIAVVSLPNGRYAPLSGLPALPAWPGNDHTTRALPATTGAAPVPTTTPVIARPQRTPRASWQMFIRHQDPATVPLGVNEATGQPVFLNRLHNPHLLIAGTTGAGKTTAGLAPFVAGNWGNQAHVVVINSRGSDFAPFAGQPNLTLWPALRPLALLQPLADFLTCLVEEMYRRDAVLARYGAHSWAQLPAQAGETGELLIAIDEFLTIVGAAREASELARLASDTETAKGLAYQATLLWMRLLALTNEGRKYGLYLAVTMTDPSREAIGEHGMRLRRQMATIGFRMNSPASSRAFLDVSGADGLASGSAGLANGRFVYNISGVVGTAVGFFPDPADLHRFFASRPVIPQPLPESLANAIANLPSPAYTAVSAPPYPRTTVYAPYVSRQASSPFSQAERDGQALRPYLAGLKSLNAAGSLLSDVSGRPSGQFLQERLKPALRWLYETENNPNAARLLARFSE